MTSENELSLKGKKILIVDDHKNIRLTLSMTLEAEGANITEAESVEQGFHNLTATKKGKCNFDLVLLDIRLPDGKGTQILEHLHQMEVSSRVIMISGEGTVKDAFHATQLGAFDYIEKPFNPERILVSANRCLDFNNLNTQNKNLRKLLESKEILGNSPGIQQVQALIQKVAPTNGRVLIVGESGTGKELVAKAIHEQSKRADRNLIKINCSAIPLNLIESELFGHEKGAFTGAIKERKGVFSLADGGTLFLDEIGELELSVQAKLLRALQNGEITPVGSEKVQTVDVRLIAATNRDLQQMVNEGDFREDLYYRLNVLTIKVPPLRDRSKDVETLAEAFLNTACQEHSLGERVFSSSALQQLSSYSWPGNVRQLRNFVERAAILSDSSEISSLEGLDDLTPKSESPQPQSSEDGFIYQADVEPWHTFHETAGKMYLKYILRKAGGNVSEAARLLCLERAYLHRLMRKLGVNRDVVVE